MAIIEAEFDNEKELESWLKAEFSAFLPSSLMLDAFAVSTPSGKRGIPDGFAFDFNGRQWYVIECELLKHGVWPHIAEQITRFVVAMKNPATLRVIRDRVFEQILASDAATCVASQLDSIPERLLQQIELFVEGIRPQFAIFIDKTNKDLQDMADALDAPTLIFRVQKFLVDGKPEYHSPDRNLPAIASDPDDLPATMGSEYEVVELLGGGDIAGQTGRFKCYRLANGSIIHIKKSKYHERGNYYWYGLAPAALDHFDQFGVTHVVFIMGDYGFANIPVTTVKQYLKNTKVTAHSDGSIRHYHLLISHDAEPELYWSNDVPKFSLTDCFSAFE